MSVPGLIISAPNSGSGKTILALKIVEQIKKKTIIFVQKTFLKNQWIERIQQFLPNAKIGCIQGPIIDIDNKDIVIAMVQSISMKSYPDTMFNSFGLSAMSWLVNQFQTVWVVAFVILFQPEIRRLLIYVGQTRFFQRIFKSIHISINILWVSIIHCISFIFFLLF